MVVVLDGKEVHQTGVGGRLAQILHHTAAGPGQSRVQTGGGGQVQLLIPAFGQHTGGLLVLLAVAQDQHGQAIGLATTTTATGEHVHLLRDGE